MEQTNRGFSVSPVRAADDAGISWIGGHLNQVKLSNQSENVDDVIGRMADLDIDFSIDMEDAAAGMA